GWLVAAGSRGWSVAASVAKTAVAHANPHPILGTVSTRSPPNDVQFGAGSRGRMPGDEDVPSADTIQRARKRIQVRRFAGPAHYTEHLSHLRIAHLTDLHI